MLRRKILDAYLLYDTRRGKYSIKSMFFFVTVSRCTQESRTRNAPPIPYIRVQYLPSRVFFSSISPRMKFRFVLLDPFGISLTPY